MNEDGPGALTADELFSTHVELVDDLMRQYCRVSLPQDALEDVRQEAMLGLLEASRRFEERRKRAFEAFARKWVRGAIKRAVQDAITHRTRIKNFDHIEIADVSPQPSVIDDAVLAAVRRLSPFETWVILNHHHLEGGQGLTQTAMARASGLSLHRIRQIIAVAEIKLSQMLAPHLGRAQRGRAMSVSA